MFSKIIELFKGKNQSPNTIKRAKVQIEDIRSSIIRIIGIFGVSPQIGHGVSFVELNRRAIQVGYIVHPNCCNDYVETFVNRINILSYSIHYKNFLEVNKYSKWDCFLNQLTTYVTANETAESACWLIPGGSQEGIDFSRYRKIKPITMRELYEKCCEAVFDTSYRDVDDVVAMCNYIWYYVNNNDVEFDIERVRNIEAISMLCNKLGIPSSKCVELIGAQQGSTKKKILAKANVDDVKSSIIKLIGFFGVAPQLGRKISIVDLNYKAAQVGYIVHPHCCNEVVEAFIEQQNVNFNSTFYKNFSEVMSKSRIELLIEQLVHYATTYGTDFQTDPYIPNDNPEKQRYNSYSVIRPIMLDELYEKCRDMIYNSVALNSETVMALCDFIWYYVSNNATEFDINKVQNREAVTMLCDKLGLLPSNPELMLRCLIYRATGEMLIIKNKFLIEKIKYSDVADIIWHRLNEEQLNALASVFYRYKELFLAFRYPLKGAYRTVVNKIRRKAIRYHQPHITGFWEEVLRVDHSTEELKRAAFSLNNFKIVSLLQAIKEREAIIADGGGAAMYIVRNGKVYVKDANYKNDDLIRTKRVYDILYAQLIDNLAKKACVVNFPKNLSLTCPVSEKKFIGNIPFGSSYKMSNHNFIGIYWRNEWGTHDFDLSLCDYQGYKIGWNSDYVNGDASVVYSGDMTDADPEATEILYCKYQCPDGVIYVNRYNGKPFSKFRMFFGRQEIAHLTRNYMVDPNCIELDEMIPSKEKSETMVGYIRDSKVYFVDLSMGAAAVSTPNDEVQKIMKRRVETYIDLRTTLLLAGFREFNPEEHDAPDLDLDKLQKDTLIKLFS